MSARWRVTWTRERHKKKPRKRDGRLDVDAASRSATLYDEKENDDGTISFEVVAREKLPPKTWETLESGAEIELTENPVEAVRGVDFVYTDTWTSMGQEEEAERRRRIFADYQVNEELLAAVPDARVLHCMPAHRGEEVTDEVLDGPRSLIYDQAENRLHAQKAIMERLMLAGRS